MDGLEALEERQGGARDIQVGGPCPGRIVDRRKALPQTVQRGVRLGATLLHLDVAGLVLGPCEHSKVEHAHECTSGDPQSHDDTDGDDAIPGLSVIFCGRSKSAELNLQWSWWYCGWI